MRLAFALPLLAFVVACGSSTPHEEPPAPRCGDGTCTPPAESITTCPEDCTPSSTPVCGNGVVEAGEVCDSGARNGRPGACNETCSGMVPRHGPPAYSGGACPSLVTGLNTGFVVPNADPRFPARAGQNVQRRDFELLLPQNPRGAPVIFTWHWFGGNARDAINMVGLQSVHTREGVIVASFAAIAPPPDDGRGYYEWYTGGDPAGNPDLELAEELLACLHETFEVDLTRVFATGHSAGAMWTAYLTQHWSHRLAAAATLSGGLQYIREYLPAADQERPVYTTPEVQLPVLLLWGGPGDTFSAGPYPTFSFEEAARRLGARLRADGHRVVECSSDFGHSLPPAHEGMLPGDYLLWPFFLDHPRGGTPYGTAADFPASFPAGWCSIPE